jgi:iron complex transport system substrate-binding protein
VAHVKHQKLLVLLLLFGITAVGNAYAKTPKRIVSLAPAVTEILYTIGAGDRVVGVTKYCLHPEEARLKPKVGGFTDHNLEAIVLLEPDLVVLTPNSGSKMTSEKLNQLGIQTLVVPLYGLEELTDSFQILGEATGLDARAGSARADLERAIHSIKENNRENEGRNVAFVNWHSPLILPTAGTLEGDLIELVGGSNIVEKWKGRYLKLSIELLIERDPDVIIDASIYEHDIPRDEKITYALHFWNDYGNLNAVANKQVFLLITDLHAVPGPRTPLFAQILNEIVNNPKPTSP